MTAPTGSTQERAAYWNNYNYQKQLDEYYRDKEQKENEESGFGSNSSSSGTLSSANLTGNTNVSGDLASLMEMFSVTNGKKKNPFKVRQLVEKGQRQKANALDMLGSIPDVDKQMGMLNDQYRGVKDAFNPSNTIRSFNESANLNLQLGQQAGNNAAQNFLATNPNDANAGTAAALIRAQSLLPTLQQNTQGRIDIAKYADESKQKALETSANIASTMASVKSQYTSTLANYRLGKANIAQNYDTMNSGNMFRAKELNMQNRQNNATNQLDAGRLALGAQQGNIQMADFLQRQSLMDRLLTQSGVA